MILPDFKEKDKYRDEKENCAFPEHFPEIKHLQHQNIQGHKTPGILMKTTGTTTDNRSVTPPVLLRFITVGCLIFISILFLFIYISGEGSGRVYTVDEGGGGDFTTIQEAVDAAGDDVGDVVEVREGSYGGNITINKKLSVVGESREGVRIESGGEFGFHVTRDGATIRNLTITGLGRTGILLKSSDNALSGITIQHIGDGAPLDPKRGYGIHLSSSHHNLISSSRFDTIGKNGLFGRGGVALRLEDSHFNSFDAITIDTVLSGSEVGTYPGNGIELVDSNENRFTDFVVVSVNSTAVSLRNSGNCSFENGDVRDCGNSALYSLFSNTTILTGSVFEDTVDSIGSNDVVIEDSSFSTFCISSSERIGISNSSVETLRLDGLLNGTIHNISFSLLVAEGVNGTRFTALSLGAGAREDDGGITVHFNNSRGNTIENSRLGGFSFYQSQKNSLLHNTFTSLVFPGNSDREDYDNHIPPSNTILGEQILYLFGEENELRSLDGVVVGQLVVAWCTNLTITDGLCVYEGGIIVHSSDIALQRFSFATTRPEALLIEHSSHCLVNDSLFLSEFRSGMRDDIRNATGKLLNVDFTPHPHADSYFSPKGIVINDTHSSAVTGTMFFYNESYALSVVSSSRITIRHNNFSKELNLTGRGGEAIPGGTGVSLDLGLQCTVTGNVFFKYKYGLFISESQTEPVGDNLFLNNQFSVRSSDSAPGSFEGNVIKDSELGYLFVRSSTKLASREAGDMGSRSLQDGEWNILEGERLVRCESGVRVRDSLLKIANGTFEATSQHTVEVYESGFVQLINSPSPPSLMALDADSEIEIYHILHLSIVNRDGAGVARCDVEVVDSDEEELVFYRTEAFGGTNRRTSESGELPWLPALSAVMESAGTSTHVCTVRIAYSDFTATEERLAVDRPYELSMVVGKAAPLQTELIPDTFSLEEDAKKPIRIDLAPYFVDERDVPTALAYNIMSLGGVNSTKAELSIVDGHVLSVGINRFTGKNWYGYLEYVVVSATDSDMKVTQSNAFTISVLPMNDPPTAEMDEQFMISGVTVLEDTPFWLELTIFDVDNDASELQIMTNDTRAEYNKENSTLVLLFPEGSSSTVLNISVSDEEETGFLEIDVHFQDVNDNPAFSFLITEHEGVDSFLISWLDEDVDSSAKISLYYDTDSSGEDGTLIAGNIPEDDEDDSYPWDLSELPKGYYYLYGVIQDEEQRVVVYHQSRIRVSHSVLSFSPGAIQLEPSHPKKGDDVIVRGTIENSGDVDVVDAVLRVYLDSELRDEHVLSGTFRAGEKRNFELYLGTLDSTSGRITITYKVPPGSERNLTELSIEAEEKEDDEGALPGFELYGVLAAVGAVVVVAGLWKKKR